ncbi:unnamed protein product [Discosporangium mesarthrocarpum]
MVLALAALEDSELKHWDVKQAFCPSRRQGGYICSIVCEGCGDDSGKVVKLRKSFHGTKQASRNFYLMLKVLAECGFEKCATDPCMRLMLKGIVCCDIATHVDDFMVAGTHEILPRIQDSIQKHFEIEDLGDLVHYMGGEVSRSRTARTLTLCQSGYIKEIGRCFGVDGTMGIHPTFLQGALAVIRRTSDVPTKYHTGKQQDASCGVD